MTIKTKLSRRAFLSASTAAVSTGLVAFPHLAIAKSKAISSTTSLFGAPPPGVAKLNANENPYGPSPKAIAAMTEAISKGAYYVGGAGETLKAMIAERHGLTKKSYYLKFWLKQCPHELSDDGFAERFYFRFRSVLGCNIFHGNSK